MNRGRRTGVLGGTFDPIHLGHLSAASAAAGALALDEVLFVPSHRPPHRGVAPGASASHRLAMVKLAVQADARFRASDIELRVRTRSFTAVTLRALHALGYRASQLFFIIGSDAFAEIATWHDYPAVLDLAHFAVVSRPGRPLGSLATPLVERTREIGPGVRLADDVLAEPRIVLIPAETPDVSSTDVRARAAAGESLEGLVPTEVERYIRRHRLYAGADPDPSTATS